ncbi:hypothetical protein BOTBODRAFT_42324 [Botryobasidium botryosum FD-172 SS1]|uniref:Uncharacterized protein n=1 Tax=Botryobasidium botryosum (strain FD-172 SS1) TaxID=930990 RepID=A0A067MVK6_BOTB1|nr:hypothetical protein BOTBODRAFT_42324 [Botryobasidium botryosum FD-172 SS1]
MVKDPMAWRKPLANGQPWPPVRPRRDASISNSNATAPTLVQTSSNFQPETVTRRAQNPSRGSPKPIRQDDDEEEEEQKPGDRKQSARGHAQSATPGGPRVSSSSLNPTPASTAREGAQARPGPSHSVMSEDDTRSSFPPDTQMSRDVAHTSTQAPALRATKRDRSSADLAPAPPSNITLRKKRPRLDEEDLHASVSHRTLDANVSGPSGETLRYTPWRSSMPAEPRLPARLETRRKSLAASTNAISVSPAGAYWSQKATPPGGSHQSPKHAPQPNVRQPIAQKLDRSPSKPAPARQSVPVVSTPSQIPPSRASIQLAGLPIQSFSDADFERVTRIGTEIVLARMSANHGFTPEVVTRAWEKTGDLVETDNLLRRMREAAALVADSLDADAQSETPATTPPLESVSGANSGVGGDREEKMVSTEPFPVYPQTPQGYSPPPESKASKLRTMGLNAFMVDVRTRSKSLPQKPQRQSSITKAEPPRPEIVPLRISSDVGVNSPRYRLSSIRKALGFKK